MYQDDLMGHSFIITVFRGESIVNMNEDDPMNMKVLTLSNKYKESLVSFNHLISYWINKNPNIKNMKTKDYKLYSNYNHNNERVWTIKYYSTGVEKIAKCIEIALGMALIFTIRNYHKLCARAIYFKNK